MRILLAIAALVLSLPVLAQDWSIVLPDEQLNFRLDTTQLISRTISVDSSATSDDVSIFHLNRNVVPCTETPDSCEIECSNDRDYLLNYPGPLGWSILDADTAWYLNSLDTIQLHKTSVVGSTWTWYGEIEATLDSIGTIEIFETVDSAKWIGLSTGASVVQSKSYGVIQIPADTNLHWLLTGMNGSDLGEFLPGFDEIFDFEVGDVHYFYGGVSSSNAFFRHYRRREVMAVNEFEDAVVVDFKDGWFQWFPVLMEGDVYSEYSGLSYYTEIYYKDDWPILGFDTRKLTTPDCCLPAYDWPDEFHFIHFSITPPGLGSVFDNDTALQRHVRGILPVSQYDNNYFSDYVDWGYSITFDEQDIQTTGEVHEICAESSNGFGTGSIIFASGLGIIHALAGDELAPHFNDMIAFETSQGSHGEIPSCEDISTMSVASNSMFRDFRIWNSTGKLHVELLHATNGDQQLDLFDTSGRRIRSWPIKFGQQTFDVSELLDGIYLARLANTPHSKAILITR